MTGKLYRSGPGWRFGSDPAATPFTGLVGAEDWAIELTTEELEDFCRLFQQLAETMQAMAAELMPEEAIACELETDRIWLEASGFPNDYRLHLIVSTGRRAEGEWSAAAVSDLLQAVRSRHIF